MREWQVVSGLIYGRVKKCYRRRKLVRVRHVMRLGTKDALTIVLQELGLSGRLNTAFIERVNLPVRHGVAVLARRTWATVKPAPHLLAHLQWWRVYYHGCRVLMHHCGCRIIHHVHWQYPLVKRFCFPSRNTCEVISVTTDETWPHEA